MPTLPLRSPPEPLARGPNADNLMLYPEEQYVVFAALAAMVDDVHTVQDQMSEEQWAIAEALYHRIRRMVDRRDR